MLHQYQSYADDIRSDLYSKYQCHDRKSSASSTASTASSGSNHSFSQKFTQVSRQVLANALQKNWNDNFANQTGYDESLTNLNWLHNVNPIKINEQLSFSPDLGYPKDRVNPQICPQRNVQTYPNQHCANVPSSTRLMSREMVNCNQPDYKHNPNLKPPFSYAILISWAMKELGKPKITLSDIYSWIMENFAYYRHADSSWQNSIRHNLSLGKCFEKVPRRKDEPGKGGFWRINPQHSRTLDMNLSKIKYNPFHQEVQSTKSDNVFPMPRLKSDIIHLSNSTSTPIKRSRKSPLTVTEENWDSQEMYNDEYHSNESMTFDDSPNLNNQGCFDLSPFDNSSSDSNNLGPPSDNISMNNFDDDSLDYILNSPMLLNKEDTFNNDEFRLQLSNNDLSDFFLTSKDDLQELDCLLGIY